MLDTMMPLPTDDDMMTSKAKYDCGSLADSTELLNVLKRECLERKALTRVERLQNSDALRNGSLDVGKLNRRYLSIKEEKRSPSPRAENATQKAVADYGDNHMPIEHATYNDSKTLRSVTHDSTAQGRIYFMSESYENVSGDESTNGRSLDSANGVSHEMIQRFLPLVDAMEQVVPSETEDVLDEGGLVIDDAEASARQTFPAAGIKEQECITDSRTEAEGRRHKPRRVNVRKVTQCAGNEPAEKPGAGPRAKRVRASKMRRSAALLEKLRSTEKRSRKEGTDHRPASEATPTVTVRKEKNSGSEVPSEDDSSTTTVDGTEYPSSSDEETNKVSVPEMEDTAAQRHGAKRLVRTAEELRKSIVKDPLNEESRYNRLVQELPGFNWLEQKIMGHSSAPAKASVTVPPPPLNGKEYPDGDAKSSSSPMDILSRSMSEIQDDGVFTETHEGETIIKCASTQTEHAPNIPTPGHPDPPPSLKMDAKSRPPLVAVSSHSSTTLSPPAHPMLVRVPEVPSNRSWHPRQSPNVAGRVERQQNQSVHCPTSTDTDVMYIGGVNKTEQPLTRGYGNVEPYPQASQPSQPHPRPIEALPHPVLPEAQQKPILDTQRQLFPWVYRPDGPPPLSSMMVQHSPQHGAADVGQQGIPAHRAVGMPERFYGPTYVQMAQKVFRTPPLVAPGEVSPRMNNMPMYSYFGFPRIFMPHYPRPGVQGPDDGHTTTDGNNMCHEKNAMGVKASKPSELQKELQKTPRVQKTYQNNDPQLPRPSVAVAPQNHREAAHQEQRRMAVPHGLYPVPRRPQPERAKPTGPISLSPSEAQSTSPTKRAERTEHSPLAIVCSQPTVLQEPVPVSPAVLERHSPENNNITQNTEQELLKRKDELKYLDHLASQKEAEFERLLQMKAEKLRILTELENRIRTTSETEMQEARKSPPAIVPLLPYPSQGARVYREPRSDSEAHPQRPRTKYDTEVSTPKVPSQSVPSLTLPRNAQGGQYPLQSPPSTAVPVMPAANIPLTVPLIGRGLFNVRSIEFPREIPPAILHDNAAPVVTETRSFCSNDYSRHASPTVPQNPQVKRAHSSTDVQKQQEECRRMPAAPQPHPTVQRPYPQRVTKPPPLQPETHATTWSFKEGYRPDLSPYYGQQTYPFRCFYGGGKTVDHSPHPGVQQYGATISRGSNGASYPATGYSASWSDCAAAARAKFVHHPAKEQRERNMDSSAHRTAGADMKSYRRPSDEERAFYEQELARDAARMASSTFARVATYGTDPGRNPGHAVPNPQKPQPPKEAPSKCALCGKYAQYLCSGCQSVWYCGPLCQKSNWSNHSSHCHNAKRSMEKHHDGQQQTRT